MTPTRSEGEPHDELTRIAARMLDVTPDDVRSVVMVERDGRLGTALHGFEDDAEAFAWMFAHLAAIAKVNGVRMMIAPVGEG